MTKKWDQIKLSLEKCHGARLRHGVDLATWLSELRQRCGLTQADMAQYASAKAMRRFLTVKLRRTHICLAWIIHEIAA